MENIIPKPRTDWRKTIGALKALVTTRVCQRACHCVLIEDGRSRGNVNAQISKFSSVQRHVATQVRKNAEIHDRRKDMHSVGERFTLKFIKSQPMFLLCHQKKKLIGFFFWDRNVNKVRKLIVFWWIIIIKKLFKKNSLESVTMPLTPPPARGKPQSYYNWESVVRRANANNMQLIQQNLRLSVTTDAGWQ